MQKLKFDQHNVFGEFIGQEAIGVAFSRLTGHSSTKKIYPRIGEVTQLTVPLAEIYTGPIKIDHGRLNWLVSSINAGDETPPILVVQERNRYRVVDGRHRYKALETLGIRDVHVYLIEDNLFDVFITDTEANSPTDIPLSENDLLNLQLAMFERWQQVMCISPDEPINLDYAIMFAFYYNFACLPVAITDHPWFDKSYASLWKTAITIANDQILEEANFAPADKWEIPEGGFPSHLIIAGIRRTYYDFYDLRRPGGLIDRLSEFITEGGKLTLPILMSLWKETYEKHQLVNSSYASTSNADMILLADYQKTARMSLYDQSGVRNISIMHSIEFSHPEPALLRLAGHALIEKINEFFTGLLLGKFDQDSAQLIIRRIHVMCNALHLPFDGAGRFSGDVYDLLNSVCTKVWSDYHPIPISVTGFRGGNFLEYDLDDANLHFYESLRQEAAEATIEFTDSMLISPEMLMTGRPNGEELPINTIRLYQYNLQQLLLEHINNIANPNVINQGHWKKIDYQTQNLFLENAVGLNAHRMRTLANPFAKESDVNLAKQIEEELFTILGCVNATELKNVLDVIDLESQLLAYLERDLERYRYILLALLKKISGLSLLDDEVYKLLLFKTSPGMIAVDDVKSPIRKAIRKLIRLIQRYFNSEDEVYILPSYLEIDSRDLAQCIFFFARTIVEAKS